MELMTFLFLGGLPAGVVGAAAAVAYAWLWCRELSGFQAILPSVIFGLSGYVFGVGAFWAWVLRDGLGPGMIASTGLEACMRFAQVCAPPSAVAAVIAAAGAMVAKRRLARIRS